MVSTIQMNVVRGTYSHIRQLIHANISRRCKVHRVRFTCAMQTLVSAVIANESRIHMSTVRSTYSHTRQLCFNIRLRHKDIDKIEDIVKSIRDYLTRRCVLYLCPQNARSNTLQLVQDKSGCLKIYIMQPCHILCDAEAHQGE